MQIVGDVAGRMCIIVDDMIDTGGTMVKGVNLLKACAPLLGAHCAPPPGSLAQGGGAWGHSCSLCTEPQAGAFMAIALAVAVVARDPFRAHDTSSKSAQPLRQWEDALNTTPATL